MVKNVRNYFDSQKNVNSELLYRKKTRFLSKSGLFGGDKRDRTADLLNAIQALSQLSYTPKFSSLSDSFCIIAHLRKMSIVFFVFSKNIGSLFPGCRCCVAGSFTCSTEFRRNGYSQPFPVSYKKTIIFRRRTPFL